MDDYKNHFMALCIIGGFVFYAVRVPSNLPKCSRFAKILHLILGSILTVLLLDYCLVFFGHMFKLGVDGIPLPPDVKIGTYLFILAVELKACYYASVSDQITATIENEKKSK